MRERRARVRSGQRTVRTTATFPTGGLSSGVACPRPRAPQTVEEQIDESLHDFVITDTQVTVAVHQPLDGEVSAQVEKENRKRQPGIVSTPAWLLLYALHVVAEHVPELLGNVMEDRGEMPVLEFDDVDIDQQPVRRIVVYNRAHRGREQPQITSGKWLLEAAHRAVQKRRHAATVAAHQAIEDGFLAGIVGRSE